MRFAWRLTSTYLERGDQGDPLLADEPVSDVVPVGADAGECVGIVAGALCLSLSILISAHGVALAVPLWPTAACFVHLKGIGLGGEDDDEEEEGQDVGGHCANGEGGGLGQPGWDKNGSDRGGRKRKKEKKNAAFSRGKWGKERREGEALNGREERDMG